MERGWVNPGLVVAILSVMAMSCVGYFGSEKANLAYSNELTEVWGGKAELIVPAERRPTRAEMSPGGRWMLVLFSTGSDWRLLDLVAKTEEKVDVGCYLGDVVWLEDEVFVATNALNCYYLSF